MNRIILHYNKEHNRDQSVPPWVIKEKGQTYYVNHVEVANLSFRTKETPNNLATKGSIQFYGTLELVSTDEGTVAYISAEGQAEARTAKDNM